jgi:hypothetical protein
MPTNKQINVAIEAVRVTWFLKHQGPARVSTIARALRVSRQCVYRVLPLVALHCPDALAQLTQRQNPIPYRVACG